MLNKGLATPVSLSFLIFSFTIITVATYYVAMSSVSIRSSRLSYAVAKQDMLALENAIRSVSWSSGSSMVKEFQGHGGEFETKPNDRRLIINISLGSTSEIVFNSTIGYVRYELPAADRGEVGWYLQGDAEPIVNQSFLDTAQMYIRVDNGSQEIYLGYRPLAISFLDSSQSSQVNVVRIFIINLNSSESVLFTGGFRLRIQCLNITSQTRSYNITDSLSSATVRVTVDGDAGTVLLPLSSGGSFTLVRLEILVCNVKLEEVNL
ncbi:TPA: hypothetical protein EYP75_01765 [Candidatus Bathyarchaeota archaeon]|nr:hypothetical protein [Candidatus Bathyarchaeota archaeon]